MLASPITNPTPYTCPTCGAGLEEFADFCPHCRENSNLSVPSEAKIAWPLCGLISFGGLGMAAIIGIVWARSEAGGGGHDATFIFFSSVLFIVFLIGMLLCAFTLWRRLRRSLF